MRALERPILVGDAAIVAGRPHAVVGAEVLVPPGQIVPRIAVEIAERPNGILQPFGQCDEALAAGLHPNCRAVAKHPATSSKGRILPCSDAPVCLPRRRGQRGTLISPPRAELRHPAPSLAFSRARGISSSAGPKVPFRVPTAIAVACNTCFYFIASDAQGGALTLATCLLHVRLLIFLKLRAYGDVGLIASAPMISVVRSTRDLDRS
ncbi:hypothetical protein ACVWWI_006480 [Bradyrhizobium sp. USDA 3686]|nr:hypothetical protein [Bradyrhizobium canariense]